MRMIGHFIGRETKLSKRGGETGGETINNFFVTSACVTMGGGQDMCSHGSRRAIMDSMAIQVSKDMYRICPNRSLGVYFLPESFDPAFI